MYEPKCDMRADCTKPVAMIDDAGFIYCERHGMERRAGGWLCRTLRAHELNRLKRGEQVKRY